MHASRLARDRAPFTSNIVFIDVFSLFSRQKQLAEQDPTCLSRMSFLAKARPHSLLAVNLPPT